MSALLKLMVARAPVESKEQAGYRHKPGGIMDVETVFDLSDEAGRDALADTLKTRGYTVWRFEGTRSKANARSMVAVALDYDHGKTADELSDEFVDIVHVIAPTARHTAERQRFRVLLPLDECADDPLKFTAMRKWLIGRFPDSDPKMFTISQPCFPCAKYYLNDNDKKVQSWAHRHFDEYFRVNMSGDFFQLPAERFMSDAAEADRDDSWPNLDSGLTKYRKELYRRSLSILLDEAVKVGGRDNHAIVIASESRKADNDSTETGRLLHDWNENNSPPLSLDDLERIVRSAYTGDGYDYGEGNESLKNARKKAREDIKKKQPLYGDDDDDDDDDFPDDDGMKMPPSLADLMEDPKLTERPKTVGNWISWRRRITLLVGSAKKSGKSTLCTYESLAVLDDGGVVLWVSNDEPLSDVARRFKEADIDADAALRVFVLHNEIPGVMPNSWKKLYQVIVATDPDIIVLDSIHTLFPLFSKSGEVPESHATAAWQAETSRLRRAALSADAAVVWIHHENKSGTSAGSVGIEAAVDVIAHLQRSGGRNQNMRALSFLGRFVGPANNKVLQYMNETDGYKEIDLKDDDRENGHDSDIVEWILEQFNGNDEIRSTDMNKRIKTKYGKSPVTVKHVRHVAIEFLGVLILSAGVPGGGGPPVKVWRMPPGADPSRFTKGDDDDQRDAG